MKLLLPEAILALILGIGLCLSPWTGQFSFEFSFFLAIGFFSIVTISTFIRFKKINFNAKLNQSWVFSYLLLLTIPLTTVILFSFKYKACSYLSGLIWFLLLPAITTVYTVACAIWANNYHQNRVIRFLITLSPTIIFSIVTVMDLYRDPALSFYHPVLGYFPGPLYDAWVPRFFSIYTYRSWTLIFSLWLMSKNMLPEKKWKIYAFILLPLLFRGNLGWHYSHPWVQRSLSSEVHTSHVKVYFHGQDIQTVRRFAKSLDFYIEIISKKLNLEIPTEKFRVYVYKDAAEKKKWTGTAYTLIGNPIQKTLQLLPTDESDTILIHELTHVVASPMGIPFLKISPKIGLLEGLATSFQPSQMKLSTHEWSKAMLDLKKLPDLSTALEPISFWKESPTKVYLATGSFSQWLIDVYGVDHYKKVYRGESFEKAYNKSLPELIEEWKKFLQKIQTPAGYVDMVDYFLSEKPFYQKKCSHEIADLEMKFETCKSDCEKYLTKACDLDPGNPDLNLIRARHIFQKDIHATIDATMIPLPSADHSRIQNNKIQLFDDDLHHVQDPNHTYNQDAYQTPSFELTNAILTRIYLAKHAPEVLDGVLLGTYTPETTLTWPKDEYLNQAMLYFSKLSVRAKQPENALFFLHEIKLNKIADAEFELAYWTMFAQANEALYRFNDAMVAYQKMSEMSATQGMKAFADLQIERLNYLMRN